MQLNGDMRMCGRSGVELVETFSMAGGPLQDIWSFLDGADGAMRSTGCGPGELMLLCRGADGVFGRVCVEMHCSCLAFTVLKLLESKSKKLKVEIRRSRLFFCDVT